MVIVKDGNEHRSLYLGDCQDWYVSWNVLDRDSIIV
jgi:hypothetical protein